MEVRILIETAFENGDVRQHDLGRFSRPTGAICPEGIGLMLEDARTILKRLQTAIVVDQVEEISRTSQACPACRTKRRIHDYRTRNVDTLFGRISVRVPRMCTCSCQAENHRGTSGAQSILSNLLPDRATLEFLRMHAELGSRHSFREAARIMETFLPCAPQSHVTVRNRLGRVAQKMEGGSSTPSHNGVRDDGKPAGATLFLDGAHIPSRPEYQRRHLDVLVGKIEGPRTSRRFGLVKDAAPSPIALLRDNWLRRGGAPVTRSPF